MFIDQALFRICYKLQRTGCTLFMGIFKKIFY